MRTAILSDIHGNLAAFGAVLADVRSLSPDLVLHGGDLADSGSSPAEIIDRIRDLGWPGVAGNTDEMLFRPESLDEFAAQSPAFRPLLPIISEMAAAARDILGEERLAWMRALPRVHLDPAFALVHASPNSLWRSPMPEASDEELASVYTPLERPIAIYGHVHRPFVRQAGGMTIVNSGSVGQPYDGDHRASYLLLDGSRAEIRRVPYYVDRELRALATCGRPHAAWIAKILSAARPQMP